MKHFVAVALATLPLCIVSPASEARADDARALGSSAHERAVEGLRAWVESRGGRASVSIVHVETGAVLGASSERLPLNPASNAKVLTAGAALARLGPSFRYTTGVYGRVEGGVARRLVLRGHGDPSLTLADLWRLARSLEKRGLRRVTGGIEVDQSRFDEKFVPPAFEQQPNEWASFRAPVSALSLDRNAVTMNVLAAEPGQPAKVWFDPPGVVGVEGSVATKPRGSGQGVRLRLHPGVGLPLRASVGGHVSDGLPRLRFQKRVDDPRLVAGFVFKHLLGELGVDVKGGVSSGGADEKRRLTYVGSERLSALLAELGKESDNFYAEMVLKTLGAEARGAPGTSAAGAAVVTDWMKKIGAYHRGIVVRNGSGLFDANRLSAKSLTGALRALAQDSKVSNEFVAHLAVGGADGTLRSRFRSHGKSRRIRAKTGTLARADALSGYVLDPGGRPMVAFAFVVNGLAAHGAVRRRIDQVVEVIAAEAKR